MPPAKVQSYFNTWPEVIHSEIELLQQEPEYRCYRPSAASISEMEQTLIWITWINEPDTRKLIWSRAAGAPWKVICRQFGCGRTKAWQTWQQALEQIADRLNNEEQPEVKMLEEKPIEKMIKEDCGYSDVIGFDSASKPSGRTLDEIFESLVKNIQVGRDVSEEQARMEADNLVRFGKRFLDINANIIRRKRAKKDSEQT
jgi:hypothetical protein